MMDNIYTEVLALAAFFVAVENIIKGLVSAIKKAREPVDKNEEAHKSLKQENEELRKQLQKLDERLQVFEQPDSVRNGLLDLSNRVDKIERNQTADHDDITTMQTGINILLKCQLASCSDEALRQEVTNYIIDK